ncbi:MAG: hypothetical protein R2780_03280 [Crocinitomicaceae bacterium]
MKKGTKKIKARTFISKIQVLKIYFAKLSHSFDSAQDDSSTGRKADDFCGCIYYEIAGDGRWLQIGIIMTISVSVI